MIDEFKQTLVPGISMVQALTQVQARGFRCAEATKSATWSDIRPARTTSCSLTIRAEPSVWQVDVVLPEDQGRSPIRPVFTTHRISL